MVDFKKHIAKLEDKLAHKNDVATSMTLALRCWQAYRFSDSIINSAFEGRVMLQRANHAVMAAHRRNAAHVKLYCLTIFIAIEIGHYDNANEMLDKAVGYKSFLKSNQPFYYGVICFLYAYLEIHQKRARSAKKHWRNLIDHIKTASPSPYYQVMLGLLHLASTEYADAYSYFIEAYRAGCDSMFLYEGLYRYYRKTARSPENSAVLPVLIYAASRGADITDIASKYQDALSAAIAANPSGGERLYSASNYPHILKEICAHRMKRGDLGPTAYAYYKEAEHKQIYVRGLYDALIQSAYKNKIEYINHYPMTQFLLSRKDSEIDRSLAIYVYHLLLTSPQLMDLVPEQHTNIMLLAEISLESNMTTREAGSLYYHYWSKCNIMGKTGENFDKAEAFLRDNLVKFQLRTAKDSKTRYVYITEPEKRGMVVYDTEDSLTIEASTESVAYTCLGVGKRTVLDEKLTIRRVISQAGPELYLYFFQKGDRRFHVLTYLTNYYLELEEPPETAISIFEAMLAEKSIVKPYRMRILVALGRLHYNAENFDQALECYGTVDEDALDNDFIEQILNVYAQTNETKRVARLLIKKHQFIGNEMLFEAIKNLDAENAPLLAEAAYKLLIDGFFDESLLTLVFNHYDASYGEWLELSRAFENSGREEKSDPRLDSRILETALWMSKWDAESQRAFVRLFYKKSPKELEKPELISNFVEYATYKMLSSHSKPEYDALDVLEKWYVEKEPENILLAWGLSSIYLSHNITTFNSEGILKESLDALENEGILFPVFKENKPVPIPFIEKHQSFVYRGLPGKDCWLYYHIDGSSNYMSMPMQYVKYGIYVACVPVFYNEEVTYYFSEEMPSGSITTRESTIKNSSPFLHESSDQFFTLNNAIVYEQMFKHDEVEKIVTGLVRDVQSVRSKLL